jgi:hypothetical protein
MSATNQPTKNYIVKNERGEEFLLPKYAATFRILMDDKDTIRDVLNSLLQLDHDHEIVDLEYEFEKPIDIFMPENDPARLDVSHAARQVRVQPFRLFHGPAGRGTPVPLL